MPTLDQAAFAKLMNHLQMVKSRSEVEQVRFTKEELQALNAAGRMESESRQFNMPQVVRSFNLEVVYLQETGTFASE